MSVESLEAREERRRSGRPLPTGDGFESRWVEVGQGPDVGLRLHVMTAWGGRDARDPKSGRSAILFLHGFPQFSYTFRHAMRAAATAGFYAIAPDLRGYNLSDKPEGIAAYTVDRLVRDLVGLTRAFGLRRVHVVGHDWGGVLAWAFAARHPELLDRLVIVNAPHPTRFRERLLHFDQLRRSWYIAAFQLPKLPEKKLLQRGVIARIFLQSSAKPSAFSEQDLAFYEAAFHQPGAATAALNWYRAAARHPGGRIPRIESPTLVLWGDKDTALGPENADGLSRYVRDLRVRHFPNASHWVLEEEPEEINREALAFLEG